MREELIRRKDVVCKHEEGQGPVRPAEYHPGSASLSVEATAKDLGWRQDSYGGGDTCGTEEKVLGRSDARTKT